MYVSINDARNYVTSFCVYSLVILVYYGIKVAVVCCYLLDDSVSNNKRADNLSTLIDYISILYYEVTHNLDIILYGFVISVALPYHLALGVSWCYYRKKHPE